jgi:putative transposase
MKRRRHTPEQVVRKLREADRLLAEGREVPEVCKQLESQKRPTTAGAQYGGLKADDARRLKELETENAAAPNAISRWSPTGIERSVSSSARSAGSTLGGATAARTPSSARAAGRSTARPCSGCGATKACASPLGVASASGSGPRGEPSLDRPPRSGCSVAGDESWVLECYCFEIADGIEPRPSYRI